MNNQKRRRESEEDSEFSEEPSSKQQVQLYSHNSVLYNDYVEKINLKLEEFKKNYSNPSKMPIPLFELVMNGIDKICSKDLEQTRRLYPEYNHLINEIEECLLNGNIIENHVIHFIKKDNELCFKAIIYYIKRNYPDNQAIKINSYFLNCIKYSSKNCFTEMLQYFLENNFYTKIGYDLLTIFFDTIDNQNSNINANIDNLNTLIKNDKLSFFEYKDDITPIFTKIVDNNLYNFIQPLKENGFDKYDIKDLLFSVLDDPHNVKDIDSFLHYFEKDLGHINKKIDFFVKSKFNNDNIVSNCLKYNSILSSTYDESTNGKNKSNKNTFERIMQAKFGLRKND